jgi:ribonuclease HI
VTWKVTVTITPRAELVHHFSDDFTALQDALLARMNGMAPAETAAALAHPSLAEPVAAALVHAEVLARGDVRRVELSEPAASVRLRRLRAHARRVRRARSEAEAACRQEWARRSSVRPRLPLEPLELRTVRAAAPEAYVRALREELADRLPVAGDMVPDGDVALWAWRAGSAAGEPPAPVRALLECDDDTFVQALLDDAQKQENPHLVHDAVVERWGRHARTAQAWGRYGIARAEREALARPFTARRAQLDALDDAYQDAAILAARAREAKGRVVGLHERIRDSATVEPFARLVAQCRGAALLRFAAAEPHVWQRACALATRHRADCGERGDDCPQCHRALAALLTEDESGAAGAQDCEGDSDSGDDFGPEGLTPGYRERYAILDGFSGGAAVVVADAMVGDESALSGYGWAAEDGTTGHGDSMASSSGEAEVVGICQAALGLLGRHQQGPVVVLCDSTEAVDAVNSALASADPTAAHRTVLFPEGRELLGRLMPHRERLQVRWLKGHIGHDLNETADALAGLAARRATGRVSAVVARRQEKQILRSLLSESPPDRAVA